eukprot:TRINITY_DN1492_c0_g1_i4.p1 TRINITY_DN1492_c0_g1~~TRINITY_DN1492_c0_g1_i4.p1  ORF type:complete len:1555 (-),score=486.99 TRINITY_DN1492_c0_g1_i4:876-5540(-)
MKRQSRLSSSEGPRTAGKKEKPSDQYAQFFSLHPKGRSVLSLSEAAHVDDLKALSVGRVCGTGRPGHKDGSFVDAMFNGVNSFCVVGPGEIAISETRNHSIRVISFQTGLVRTIGTRNALLSPRGICQWDDHSIIVCDAGHHRIRIVDLVTGKVETLAGNGKKGSKDGPFLNASFNHPSGICVASDGTIVVADTGNHLIRRLSMRDRHVLTAVGAMGKGFRDGEARRAQVNEPTCIITGPDGNIYFSDTGNHAIRMWTQDRTVISTICGGHLSPGYKNASGTDARFSRPIGIAFGQDRSLYVCDTDNHSIRRVSKDTKYACVFAGQTKRGSADGPGSIALFDHPIGLCGLSGGALLVADEGNNCIRIAKIVDVDEKEQMWSLKFSPKATRSKEHYGREFMRLDGAQKGKGWLHSVDASGETGHGGILRQHAPLAVSSSSPLVKALQMKMSVVSPSHASVGGGHTSHAHAFDDSVGDVSTFSQLHSLRSQMAMLCRESRRIEDSVLLVDNEEEEGEMAEDRTLEAFDVECGVDSELMVASDVFGKIPISRRKKMRESILDIFRQHRNELFATFRYYSYFVDPMNPSQEMTSFKWSKFVRDCGVFLPFRAMHLARMDICYLKACKGFRFDQRIAGMSAKDFASLQANARRLRMSYPAFLNALLYLSIDKYIDPSSPDRIPSTSPPEALHRLLLQFVFPLAHRKASPPEREDLVSKEVFQIWREHQHSLEAIFTHYAENVPPSPDGIPSLSFSNHLKFVRDFEIFPTLLSKSQVMEMYRRSIAGGLDIESMKQDSMTTSGRKSFSSASDDFLLSVFTFFEFIECIGRMAVEVYENPPYDTAFPWPHNKIEALLNFMHSSAGGQMACFQRVATSFNPSLSKSFGKKAGLFPSIHAKFLLQSPVINRKIMSRSHEMVSPKMGKLDKMKRRTLASRSGLDEKYFSKSRTFEERNASDDESREEKHSVDIDDLRVHDDDDDDDGVSESEQETMAHQIIFEGMGELLLFDPILRSYQSMGKGFLQLEEDGKRGFSLRVRQHGKRFDLAMCKLVHALPFRLTLSPRMHERCLDVLEGGEDGHDPLAQWTSSRKLAKGTESSRDVQFIDQSSRVFSFHMESETDWEEFMTVFPSVMTQLRQEEEFGDKEMKNLNQKTSPLTFGFRSRHGKSSTTSVGGKDQLRIDDAGPTKKEETSYTEKHKDLDGMSREMKDDIHSLSTEAFDGSDGMDRHESLKRHSRRVSGERDEHMEDKGKVHQVDYHDDMEMESDDEEEGSELHLSHLQGKEGKNTSPSMMLSPNSDVDDDEDDDGGLAISSSKRKIEIRDGNDDDAEMERKRRIQDDDVGGFRGKMGHDEIGLLREQNKVLLGERSALEDEIDRLRETMANVKRDRKEVEGMRLSLASEQMDVQTIKIELEHALEAQMEERHHLQDMLPKFERSIRSLVHDYAAEVNAWLVKQAVDLKEARTAGGFTLDVRKELDDRIQWASAAYFAGKHSIFSIGDVPSFDDFRVERYRNALNSLVALEPGIISHLSTVNELYDFIGLLLANDEYYFEFYANDGKGS